MGALSNPDYLLSLCKKYKLSPSKKYGQNFLLDNEVITTMLKAGEITKHDTVVEVGPGFGVLTLPLAEHAGKVISFEIEKKLTIYWEEMTRKRQLTNLEIKWGNVLKSFSEAGIAAPYKVIANLPYQITSAVIRLFLETPPKPENMVCLVQKEVAERIIAKPGDLSVLALSIQYYATPEIITIVPKNSFWPVPAVDSAVIRLKPYAESPNQTQTDYFFTLIKRGFAQRRKMLFKNLLPYVPKERASELETCFKNAGVSQTVRAQEVSLDQWKKMSAWSRERQLFGVPKN